RAIENFTHLFAQVSAQLAVALAGIEAGDRVANRTSFLFGHGRSRRSRSSPNQVRDQRPTAQIGIQLSPSRPIHRNDSRLNRTLFSKALERFNSLFRSDAAEASYH